MKKILTIAAILGLCYSGIILAGTRSSVINLAGGQIAPASQLEIPLEKLVSSIDYNITCNIKNEKYTSDLVTLGVRTFTPGTVSFSNFSLNGETIYGGQGKLDKLDNELKVLSLMKQGTGSATLTLINADQDTAVTVTNCFAEAASYY